MFMGFWFCFFGDGGSSPTEDITFFYLKIIYFYFLYSVNYQLNLPHPVYPTMYLIVYELHHQRCGKKDKEGGRGGGEEG